jgi:hypothetical protein
MTLLSVENDNGMNQELLHVERQVWLYTWELIHIGKPRRTTLYQCEPPDSWFTHLDESNHHGKSHVAQLLVLGAFSYPYSRAMGLDVNFEAIGWTSILHDIAQWDTSEAAMEAHPRLAASWARKYLPGIVNQNTLQTIINTIEFHAMPPTFNSQPMTDDLRFFRSLDACALVRLGEDPRTFHLPIPELEEEATRFSGISLPSIAQQLEQKRHDMRGNPFQQVIDAGVVSNIVLPM